MTINEEREELKREIVELEKQGRREDAMILLRQLDEIDARTAKASGIADTGK